MVAPTPASVRRAPAAVPALLSSRPALPPRLCRAVRALGCDCDSAEGRGGRAVRRVQAQGRARATAVGGKTEKNREGK